MTDQFVSRHVPDARPKGVFLLLHGMESHSGWFQPLFPRLTGAGYAVVAYDRPGWGRSSGVRGHVDSYRDVFETVSRLSGELRREYGAVHLAGMSWGGMLALYTALRRPWLFNSLTLLAPGLAAQTDLPFSAKVAVFGSILGKRPYTTVATTFKPASFTADPEWQAFIEKDGFRVHQVTAGFCLETLKMRSFIKQTAGKRRLPPTLCLLAGDDRIIDNRRTAVLCQKAGAAVQIQPNRRHTLVFECPDAVAAALVQQAETASAAQPVGNVWIAGAGAIGGAVAATLAFGGVRTGLLVKEKYASLFHENGLLLKAGEGERNTEGLASFATVPEEMPADPDLVIIAVKSFDTDSLLASLAGKIPPGALVASLQNGIGNEAKIAAAFPQNTIIAGSICASVDMPGPGQVGWPDDRGGIGAALYRMRKGGSDAQTVWHTLLSRTGMECRWVDGERAAERLKWSKLMLNIGFNALNSLTGMTSGEIMADRVFGRLAVAALREGFACMDGLGLQPVDLPGFPVSKLGLVLLSPERLARKALAWQAKRSTEAAFSMRQDVLKNRQHTEIAELNGIIVQTGKKLDLPTPANSGLVEMVKKMQM